MKWFVDFVLWKYSVPTFCFSLAAASGFIALNATVIFTGAVFVIVAFGLIGIGLANIWHEANRIGDWMEPEWKRCAKQIDRIYKNRD